MEKESLKLAGRDSLLGIITGFIIASAGIAGGIFIVYLNPSSAANAIAGSAVSGSSLIVLVKTFVNGSKNQTKNQANTNDTPRIKTSLECGIPLILGLFLFLLFFDYRETAAAQTKPPQRSAHIQTLLFPAAVLPKPPSPPTRKTQIPG